MGSSKKTKRPRREKTSPADAGGFLGPGGLDSPDSDVREEAPRDPKGRLPFQELEGE